ncbi:hypothetical protein B296_00031769 [Ensete ventricosum]|uniref:Uncharacterized protein n=1 Tax=Ensete ventricosum TaxID=4639 RepID=A0A427AFA6_ENSVE|nr:hypothetical protein B296_00031769 [Ensete ventricosum]
MVLLLYVFRCSGCTHEWNLDRPPVIEEATEFFKSLGVSDFTFESGRLVGVPSTPLELSWLLLSVVSVTVVWEWRCRAKLAVRGTPENPLIGLYQEATHDIVDIPLCRGLQSIMFV